MRTTGAYVFFVLVISWHTATGCGGPQARPEYRAEPIGKRYAPLPKNVRVKLYRRGEPDESYREIGRLTSTCPVKHWVSGQHKKGRPICLKGLRQAAHGIGAQAVVDIKTERFRPPWDPEHPWLIMKAVAVRIGR